MPNYTVTIGGQRYRVNSDHELSDEDAYAAAAAQHDDTAGSSPSTTSVESPNTARAMPQAVSSDEPTTFGGGFWKGIKDYGKSLVKDPRMMGAVGATAAAATVPATGGLSLLAIPFLGAAGGAGAAHIAKQLDEGVPESSTDVLASMGTEGAINAAVAGSFPAAGWAGPKLVERAASLEPLLSGTAKSYARHAAAAVAGKAASPLAGLAIEAAGSPMVNRAAGRAMTAYSEVPATAANLARRAVGGAASEAPAVAERYTPNLSGYRPGGSFGEPAMPFESPVDPHMPNQPGFDASAAASDNTTGAASLEPLLDRYMPNVGTAEPSVPSPRATAFDEPMAARGSAPVGGADAAGVDPAIAADLRALDQSIARGEYPASARPGLVRALMKGRASGAPAVDASGRSLGAVDDSQWMPIDLNEELARLGADRATEDQLPESLRTLLMNQRAGRVRSPGRP